MTLSKPNHLFHIFWKDKKWSFYSKDRFKKVESERIRIEKLTFKKWLWSACGSAVRNSAAAIAAKSLQSCPTLCDPMTAAHQAPPSLGFFKQQHWSGLPFPSPMHESEVAQSCPTLSNPIDCSPPGSSIHGIFKARVLEWGAVAFSAGIQLETLFSKLPMLRKSPIYTTG